MDIGYRFDSGEFPVFPGERADREVSFCPASALERQGENNLLRGCPGCGILHPQDMSGEISGEVSGVKVRAKVSEGYGVRRVKAEFDSARDLAEKTGLTLKEARTAILEATGEKEK